MELAHLKHIAQNCFTTITMGWLTHEAAACFSIKNMVSKQMAYSLVTMTLLKQMQWHHLTSIGHSLTHNDSCT